MLLACRTARRAFEWPIRSSISEHFSLGLQGPNASSKLSMVGGRLRDESPRTADDPVPLLRPATVLIAGGLFSTIRRGVRPVEPGRRVNQLAVAVTVSNPTRRTQRRQIWR